MFPNPQDALPLPARPNVEQYKKLAKDLLRAAQSSEENALHEWALSWTRQLVALSGLEITPQLPVRIDRWAEQVTNFAKRKLGADAKLADAQFIISRSQGFASWPKFLEHVEAINGRSSPDARFEAAADAIISGDIKTLGKLLHADPDLVKQRSPREHHGTLLHYVSANGVEIYRQKTPKNIVEITRLLLDAGADVDAEANVYGGGSTTLGLAATSCHPEAAGVQNDLLQVLLDHGASAEQPSAAGNHHTAVIGCLANGRGRAAEYLAGHGAVLDLEGAAGAGRLDVVKSFFDEDGTLKAPATEQQLDDGFMWACQFGRDDVVAFLLEHGAHANTTGVRRKIPGLHWAGYGGHANIVRMLLERGASVNTIEPEFGGTPLGWTIYGWGGGIRGGDHYDAAAQLVRAGATVKQEWIDEDADRTEFANRIKSDPRMLAALRGELTT